MPQASNLGPARKTFIFNYAGKRYDMPWESDQPPTHEQMNEFMRSQTQPQRTAFPNPWEAIKTGIKGAVTPLSEKPTEAGNWLGEQLRKNTSPMGLGYSGAPEFMGRTLSGFTSPVGIATMAAGPVAHTAGRYGVPYLPRALDLLQKTAGAGFAAHGGYGVATEPTWSGKASSALEMLGGAAGMYGSPGAAGMAKFERDVAEAARLRNVPPPSPPNIPPPAQNIPPRPNTTEPPYVQPFVSPATGSLRGVESPSLNPATGMPSRVDVRRGMTRPGMEPPENVPPPINPQAAQIPPVGVPQVTQQNMLDRVGVTQPKRPLTDPELLNAELARNAAQKAAAEAAQQIEPVPPLPEQVIPPVSAPGSAASKLPPGYEIVPISEGRIAVVDTTSGKRKIIFKGNTPAEVDAFVDDLITRQKFGETGGNIADAQGKLDKIESVSPEDLADLLDEHRELSLAASQARAEGKPTAAGVFERDLVQVEARLKASGQPIPAREIYTPPAETTTPVAGAGVEPVTTTVPSATKVELPTTSNPKLAAKLKKLMEGKSNINEFRSAVNNMPEASPEHAGHKAWVEYRNALNEYITKSGGGTAPPKAGGKGKGKTTAPPPPIEPGLKGELLSVRRQTGLNALDARKAPDIEYKNLALSNQRGKLNIDAGETWRSRALAGIEEAKKVESTPGGEAASRLAGTVEREPPKGQPSKKPATPRVSRGKPSTGEVGEVGPGITPQRGPGWFNPFAGISETRAGRFIRGERGSVGPVGPKGESFLEGRIRREAERRAGRVGNVPPFGKNAQPLGEQTTEEFRKTYSTGRKPGFIEAVKGASGTTRAGISRALQASLDIGGPFRQGATAIMEPEWWKSWKPGLQSVKREGWENVHARLVGDLEYKRANESGVHFSDVDAVELHPADEVFKNNIAESLPGIGEGIAASNRFHAAYLNQMRKDLYTRMESLAHKKGWDINDPLLRRGIADYVNNMTGRGDLNITGFRGRLDPKTGKINIGELREKLNANIPFENMMFFSPRLIAARFNQVNPLTWMRAHPFVRQQYLKSFTKMALFHSTIIGAVVAGAIPGATVKWRPEDMTNPDWMKIKIGNTRVDLIGGLPSYGVFLMQMILGEKTSSVTGKKTELDPEKFGAPTRNTVFINFLRNKSAPIPGAIADTFAGKDYKGDPVSLRTYLEKFVPMAAGDIADLYQNESPELATALLPFAPTVGTQTYKERPFKPGRSRGKLKID